MTIKVSTPSLAELAAINGLLEERDVPAASRAAVIEAVAIAQGSNVVVRADVPANAASVALRPTDAEVAVYVHRGRLSLRLDRRRAVRTTLEYEFCSIEEGAQATAPWLHLRIDDWAVAQHAVVVRQLLLSAFLVSSAQAASEAAAAPPARTVTPRPAASAARPKPAPSAVPRPSLATPAAANGHPVQAKASGTTAQRTRTPAKATRPVHPPAPKPAVCPVHFVVMVNGHCDYCDS